MTTIICEDKVREQLKQVIDPELSLNIVDLGLIYTVNLATNAADEAKTDIQVDMVADQPHVASRARNSSPKAARRSKPLEGAGSVEIKITPHAPLDP